MNGNVLKPIEWYNKTLGYNSRLHEQESELLVLKSFIEFLEREKLYMSVVGGGRDTKNSSIYISDSASKENWLCGIKFFRKNIFVEDIHVVGKESMNRIGKIYENKIFVGILEELTDQSMQLTKCAKIKEQITIRGFEEALEIIKEAIKRYKEEYSSSV